ncbi:prephenate dehydratase [Methylobacterium sp. E-065]|uniref:prephenate dehydratase n=1 Tax=Methylobacterium sp. E-065 TaxID=2836583 RepID=UPI001FB983F8|nr:prephenate dehydratase [Methylobacterium sp. E-065]MCJ2019647.1 prephenate dehydratase [Methylobacterium sp. E-065]
MTDRTIAYQGEPGANSHIICAQAYPDWTPLPCPSFEDAFAAVTEGRAQRAMIPIENSIAGRVADIHHLIPLSPLHIVAEHFLPIHFQLMVLPGTPIEALKSVHSHVHALGQCRRIIRRLGLKAVVAGDTAGAAREIKEFGDPSRAALAPALAAEVYGLDILARDVEDEVHNTTRFVVFSPEAEPVAPGTGPCVTSFVFRVRNIPAALYKALGGFATNGVNMSKLESYMIDGEFTATQFYAEVDGHPEDPGLARALDELAFFSRELRVIGTYPAHPFREAARPAAE